MKARVYVSLKPTVLDPQGQAIRTALNSHGHARISEVRQAKYFDIAFEGDDQDAAKAEIESVARDVLANPVIEDYRIEYTD